MLAAQLLPATLCAEQRPDPELRSILREAASEVDTFPDRFDAEVWLTDMSRRLARQVSDPEERIEMIAELITDMPTVSVESFEGLTVEYAAQTKADVILRGMRSLTDVHYEFQLAMTNRAVAGIETVFIMTSEQYGFTSSTLIREVASLGGNLSNLVPKNVYDRLRERFNKK